MKNVLGAKVERTGTVSDIPTTSEVWLDEKSPWCPESSRCPKSDEVCDTPLGFGLFLACFAFLQEVDDKEEVEDIEDSELVTSLESTLLEAFCRYCTHLGVLW